LTGMVDAGGPRGISQLMILKNVMESLCRGEGADFEGVVKRPCEVFHAIGGVGTGGSVSPGMKCEALSFIHTYSLIAIFLVVLKMTATEALEEFTSLVDEVFEDVAMDPTKRTEKLKRVIEGILERRGFDKGMELIRASEPPPTCKL
jgi:hypothetical protein